jgi:hypothetical protein
LLALTPEKSGQIDGLVLPDRGDKAEAIRGKEESNRDQAGPQNGIAFQGFVDVAADGQYTFTVTSDSGAVLWLHDSLVIDDDFTHGDTPRSGTVRLKAGWHPIRLFYRHEPAQFAPRLLVTLEGPGMERGEIPQKMLGN